MYKIVWFFFLLCCGSCQCEGKKRKIDGSVTVNEERVKEKIAWHFLGFFSLLLFAKKRGGRN